VIESAYNAAYALGVEAKMLPKRLAACSITGWCHGQGIALRLSVPVALCAALAALLDHAFPDPDLRDAVLVLGLYVLGIGPLMPGMVRGMRQARRLGRAGV
jgi:hypothetical protein